MASDLRDRGSAHDAPEARRARSGLPEWLHVEPGVYRLRVDERRRARRQDDDLARTARSGAARAAVRGVCVLGAALAIVRGVDAVALLVALLVGGAVGVAARALDRFVAPTFAHGALFGAAGLALALAEGATVVTLLLPPLAALLAAVAATGDAT